MITCKERQITNPYDTKFSLMPPEVKAAFQISDNEFYIGWKKYSRNISHILIYKSVNNRRFEKIDSVASSQLYYVDKNFNPDSVNHYAISAKADKNESDYFKIENDINANLYGELSSELILEQAVKLEWDISIENVKYIEVQRKAGSDNNIMTIAKLNGNTHYFIDNDIKLCTLYSYWLKIVNNKNEVYFIKPIFITVERFFEKTIKLEGNPYASGILKINGNEYLIYGNEITSSSNCLILVVDNDGNIIRLQSYDSDFDEECTAIHQLADGSVILGSRYKQKNGSWIYCNSMIRKISSDGTLLWSKKFESHQGRTIYSIAETEDGGLMLGGGKWAGTASGWLIKTNDDGDTSWSKIIENSEQICTILALQDGNFLITGESRDENGEDTYLSLIAKIDSQGNTIWRKYDPYGPIFSTIQTSENSFVSISLGDNSPNSAIRMFSFDSNGNIDWIDFIKPSITSTYWGLFSRSIFKTNDGGIIFSAFVDLASGYGNDLRLYLRKIDQAGSLIWEKTFNNPAFFPDIGYNYFDLKNQIVENDLYDLIVLSNKQKSGDNKSHNFNLQRIIYPGPDCGDQ